MDKRNAESNILEFSSEQPTPVRFFDLSGGGGGYSLGWPIRGGSARKGYLGYERVRILHVKEGREICFWVCERAQKG